MTKTFVVPDIHGMKDLLDKAIEQIQKHDGGTVIFTGDYVDRGPDSCGVVQTMIDGPTDSRFRWSHVRGNHEDMMLDSKDSRSHMHHWMMNGGEETIVSYAGHIFEDHLTWMKHLPRLTWDKHRVYVHAGVNEQLPLENQPAHTTQWHRYTEFEDFGYRNMHVVHGHTPVVDGPECLINRTNLDTGAFFTGRFVVGVFDDDKPGGPVDMIEVSE